MSIDWQSTVALLDANPDVATAAGTTVLSDLVSSGRQYERAGRPDVLHESPAHVRWSNLKPSQKLSIKEPEFYDPAYYARPFEARSSGDLLSRIPVMPDSAPKEAKTAYSFWLPRSLQVAARIARYYIAEQRKAEAAQQPKGPTNGAIEQALVSSLSAAHAWLASH